MYLPKEGRKGIAQLPTHTHSLLMDTGGLNAMDQAKGGGRSSGPKRNSAGRHALHTTAVGEYKALRCPFFTSPKSASPGKGVEHCHWRAVLR
ncbi:hypothetical protein CALCODRAFT_243363 [Calocera cornea HHB12733]|uniref:Uncharacterized protein n=1 Tax=Calocera cornea HHB12733 TaxID=1353952 RepID=A0A165GQF1_9BASI|nr:hypothetical protein CALCODRAFT_243363 [Calocera cornea HHB12733]